MPRFAISAAPIDPATEATWLKNAGAGALASFEGWVRDHNNGRQVAALAYEAFVELATSEGQRVLAEAIERFGLEDAACVHREGALVIGDIAVWVGATAAHRHEAFRACRYIIDEIKTRLPLWKRETYRDGAVEWVNCQACATHAHDHSHSAQDEAAFYERQRRLPEVGPEGQALLKDASVLVVGAGGLGATAAQALAGAGIGRLGICDFDRLEASNLNRQFLYSHADIGQGKADLAVARLRAANPFIAIMLHVEAVTAASAPRLVAYYDVVLDCTDNFAARFALNDACMQAGRVLVAASVHRFEGQLLAVRPGHTAGCVRCLWPEPPCLTCGNGSCEEAGIVGAVPAVMGAMQALEAIKLILGLPAGALDSLVVWDGLAQQTMRLKRQRDPACGICAQAHAETRPFELISS